MALPRTTSAEEMEAVATGSGPLGGERVLEYNIFLTDAFSGQQTTLSFANDASLDGPSDQIDGFANDDSYRRSRYLLSKREDLAGAPEAVIDNFRENSLARQLQEKGERPAVIRLIRRRKPEEMAAIDVTEPRVPWVNLIPPNTKFFLEHVQENREEKVQIIDTFGQWVAFFFGRKPEIYSYSGTLLNAKNHDWKNEFQENYDYFLRGTQAVQNSATVLLQYDDVLVEGYMLNCSISMTAALDKSVPFSFNMLVLSRVPVNARGLIGLRAARTSALSLEQILDLSQIPEESVDDLESYLLMREYFSGSYLPGAGTAISTASEPTGAVDQSAADAIQQLHGDFLPSLLRSTSSTTPGQVGDATATSQNTYKSQSFTSTVADKLGSSFLTKILQGN